MRKKIHLRENWYRDVWLIIITALLATALASFESNQNDIEDQQEDTAAVVKSNRTLSTNLCKVVINVHSANRDKLKSNRHRLRTVRSYLRHLDPEDVGTNLTKQVRKTLPSAISDVKADVKTLNATRPPQECLERTRKRNGS